MFIYRSGFAQTYNTAKQWVKHGHIQINNNTTTNISHQLNLFDVITFDPKIWRMIILSYTRIFFYAS
jgi:ribosomal protein S4